MATPKKMPMPVKKPVKGKPVAPAKMPPWMAPKPKVK